MTTYRVAHHTTYRYDAPMNDGYTVACLVPRSFEWQQVLDAEVSLRPDPSEQDSYADVFGNVIHQFGLHEPHDSMTVSSVSTVDVTERPEPADDTPWEAVVEQLDALTGEAAIEVGFFRAPSTFVPADELDVQLATVGADAFAAGRGVVDVARSLCASIHEEFAFDAGFSDVSTPLAQVLEARRGVCQDFAHLAIGCLRSHGLAARYVSGYIETLPPPGEPKLVGADASHAWCSVWTPVAGWVDFDPTNGHLPVNDHVTVGWGRDYADVTPVRGVMIGPATAQHLEVSVDVARLGD